MGETKNPPNAPNARSARSARSATTRGLGAAAVAAAIAVGAMAAIPGSSSAAGSGALGTPAITPMNAVTDEVMAWLIDTDPTLIADSVCARPASQSPVAYSGNLVNVRTTSASAARLAINQSLNPLVPGPNPTGGWVVSYQRVTFPPPPTGPPIVPIVSFKLKARTDSFPLPIVALSRALRERPEHFAASPNYALAPSMGFVKFWPYGAPTPAAALEPQRALSTPTNTPLGSGVRIDIYDTGLAPTVATPYLASTAALSIADKEIPDVNGNGYVDYPHAGHGLAMAGVIATLAPGARINEGRITTRSGLATDFTAVTRMAQVMNSTPLASWPDIIVHAFGTTACDLVANQPTTDPSGLEPVSLHAFAEAVARFAPSKPDGMLLVASAGNRASTERNYPAAFNADVSLAPGIVAVGAIDATIPNDGNAGDWYTRSRSGPVSDYSNTGGWVEAFAPGDHLATTHVNNLTWLEDAGDPPNEILHGKAYVDGTSFAAPYVAGLVAEVMSTTGQRAAAAWVSIRNLGIAPTKPCDGDTRTIGPGRAVGLKSATSFALNPGVGAAPNC